jgi:hypothetical protein
MTEVVDGREHEEPVSVASPHYFDLTAPCQLWIEGYGMLAYFQISGRALRKSAEPCTIAADPL